MIRYTDQGRMETEDYEQTMEGPKLVEEVYKYVNYLHDFSLLNEHDTENVKIWDQIMIWAALLGLTDVVGKQFKGLYLKYHQETVYSSSSLHQTTSLN